MDGSPKLNIFQKMWSSFPKAKVFRPWYLEDLFGSQLKAEFLGPIPKRGHIFKISKTAEGYMRKG